MQLSQWVIESKALPQPASVNGQLHHLPVKHIEKTNPQLNRCSFIFTAQAGDDSIEVRVKNETVWLTQKLIAELFGVDVRTISEHLKNIFQSNELKDDSVIRKYRITAAHGSGP